MQEQGNRFYAVFFCAIRPASRRDACINGYLPGKYSEQLGCELCGIAEIELARSVKHPKGPEMR